MQLTAKYAGQWGVSRVLQSPDGTWTTAASLQSPPLALVIDHYFPPFEGGVPKLPWALIRIVGQQQAAGPGTMLFDALAWDTPLSALATARREALKTAVADRFTGFTYTDTRGLPAVVAPILREEIQDSWTPKTLMERGFDALAHSWARYRLAVPETHNTEYTDGFSTDPYAAPRWTDESATHTWDSGNSELDLGMATTNRPATRYSVNGPGSIEHEAQVTAIVRGSFNHEGAGAGVRFDNTGVNDWYGMTADRGGSLLKILRIQGDSPATLSTWSVSSFGAADFLTLRLAASGTAGSNVVLDAWNTGHGTSKPSDPGWYGSDGSPNHTYTDTAANRLDDSAHAHCGISGAAQGSDFDTRCCYWKSRAISDRAGGGGGPSAGVRTLGLLGVGL